MAKINKRRKKIFDMLKEHQTGLSGEFMSQQLGVFFKNNTFRYKSFTRIFS